MDESSPTLGVGFAIETGGSMQAVLQLQKAMGTAEAQIVADAARIERATGGMVNLGAGTAAVTAFGNATKREYYDLARQKAQTEKSGEALIRQLEREAAAFGKTRSEMRAAKAEALTLAATTQGNADLAERIRTAEAAIYDQEFAAARRARAEAEAAAQAKEAAAAQAIAAAEREAQAVRSAAQAHAMFEAAARRGAIAMREQQAAEEGAANEAVRMAAAAERLRGAIDPAYAAQSRFNREIEEARTLVAANAITLDDYAAKLRMEQAILAGSADAHGRVATSAGANRAAMQGLSYQVQDTMTQLSMGANAFQVIAIQGGQAAGQFANVEGKAGTLARFMIGPWGLAFTAAAMFAGPLISKLMETNKAVDDGVEKLKESAKQTAATDKAKQQYSVSLAGVTQAIRDQEKAEKDAITASRSSAEQASDNARFNLAEAASLREKTLARLKDALAAQQVLNQPGVAQERGLGSERAAINESVARLKTEIAQAEAAMGTAQGQIARSLANIADEQAQKAADPIERIKRAYEGSNGLIAKAKERLVAENATVEVMTRQLGLLRSREAAEIATAQRQQASARSAANDNRQTGRTIGLSDAEAIVRRIGGVITSSTRTFDEQRVLYERYIAGKGPLAAKPGHSDHENSSALDIRKTPGMTMAKIRDAFQGQGVAIKQLLDEGDHFHVAWKKGADAAAAASKNLGDEQQRLAKQFDPAQAAAIEYRQALAGIAAAKLDPETATRYADAARDAFVKARAAAFSLPSVDQMAAGQKIADAAEASATTFNTNVIQPLRDELALYGLVGPARDAAALDLEKQAFMAKNAGDGLAVAALRWQEYYDAKRALIEKDAAADREAEAIKRTADELDRMVGTAERAGDAFARSFGRAGEAISGAFSVLVQYHKAQKDISADTKLTAEQKRIALTRVQVEATGDLIGETKNLFKTHSTAYKAMEAAEKAYRLVQFAFSVQAMAQNIAETLGFVAGKTAQASASATAGIAEQSKLTFPYNIIAMAATGAALVAAGISVAGGFGGGGGAKAPTSNTGTGTVLGDPAAKSESIKNAIDALKEVDLLQNSYSRQMAASLRSIDNQIGGVASLVARSGDINANAGVTEGFKMNGVGSALSKIPLIGGILGGLFGSKTTVVGSGLYGGAQSVGSILNGGFDASYYSDVEKKKKLFGITTGTSYSTQFSGADANLENQFTLILKSFSDAIGLAAGPLGEETQAIQNRLNSFVVDIGRIDLQGLTGTEIEEKLQAVFGKAADGMASAAFPGLEKFQKVGEGLFETLVRVSSTVEAVTTALDQMAGVAPQLSIAAKIELADQFDSIGDFTSAVGSYFEAYYSAEEQAAAKTAQFAKTFASLGVSMPSSLAAYRALVEAQNLNTAAGQATYATLLQLAPAFAELQESMLGAKSAADITSERMDLQRQMLQLRGDTAAIRALDLAKVDPSNRALQQQIWDLQDAQDAAKAAQTLADAWQSVGDTIMTEIKRIRGLTDTGGAGFAQLQGQFNAANMAARGGDQDAAKSLPGLSQALLTAAANAATSKQELDRIERQTAASLEATYGAITALTKAGSAGTPSSTPESAASAAQGTNTSAAVNDNTGRAIAALQDEIVATRKDLTDALAQVAGNTGKMARTLDNVTIESGGVAIATVAALKAIIPQLMTDARLVGSIVPETDYPEWQAGATYATGARVIKVATHRVYESAIGGNVGHDPALDATRWIDAGPTNRWAMFDPAAGPGTVFNAVGDFKITLDDAVTAIGLIDLQSGPMRVVVTANGATLFDETRSAPQSAEAFFDLPAAANRTAAITLSPTAGGAGRVGKLAAGAVIDLGTTEDGPTVALTDFSRRDTDAFGVTTVTERGWAKRLTARCLVDSSLVDGLNRQLANIRARPALWFGAAKFASLSTYGLFKEFNIEMQVGANSYCSLTIEGMPSSPIAVTPIDPATEGVSTFRALRPVVMYDAILASTNATEDYPLWQASTTYALGERVRRTTTHRIFESAIASNVGHDPATDAANWIDAGPSNRWAMFDQALGTATTRAASLTVTLNAPIAVSALALMDVSAGTVRVQAPGYDRTKGVAGGEGNVVTFLDLTVGSGATITVTVSAAAGVPLASVGTLIFGTLEPFGVTETAPQIGITDYSKKTTDDFGNTTAVERAYGKRMVAKCMIATSALDNVVRRMASLRAIPTLWIADEGFDSLRIYGFYRDFSAVVSAQTMFGLTIEGLTTAAPSVVVPPPLTSVGWSDVVDDDPTHPKPQDGATKGAPAGTLVGGVDAGTLVGFTTAAQASAAAANAKIDEAGSTLNQSIATARAAADNALALLNTPNTGIVSRTSTLENDLNAGNGVKSRLSTVETTLTTPNTGVLARTTSLETSVNTPNTGISARLSTVEQSLASGANNEALAQRTSVLEAKIEGNQSSNLLSRITTVELAYSDPTTGLASRTSTLETSINAAGTGLSARLTTAESVLSNSTNGIVSRTATLEANAAPNANARLNTVETAVTDGRFSTAVRTTTLEAQMAGTAGSNLSSRLSTVETATTDNRFASASRASTLEAQMAGSTGSNLLTRIQQTETATTDGRFATASSVSTLSVQINGSGGLAASVSNQSSVIAGLDNNVATLRARAAVTLDVNGRMTGYEIASNGSTGTFRINADYFEIGKATGGERTVYDNNAWKVFDSANRLKVLLGKKP